MTQEEILEGNRLIAEFMGLRKIMLWGGVDFLYDIEKESYVTYVKVGSSGINATINTRVVKARPNELLFHSSWDWLMPVVEKIECKWVDGGQAIVQIRAYQVQIFLEVGYRNILFATNQGYDGKRGNKIDNTYKAVIEFIKWYNTQTK